MKKIDRVSPCPPSRWRRHAALCGAALSMFLISGAALAEPSAVDRETARRLFTEAAEHERAGQWDAAIPKLRSALEIVQTPGLEYHLAYCFEQRGDWVEALEHYQRAETLIAQGAQAKDVEKLLAERKKSLEPRVPALIVSVQTDVSPSTLLIDDREYSSDQFGRPVYVNPGRHRVGARAAGRPPAAEREVTVGEGERMDVELSWPAASPAPAPPKPVALPKPQSPAEHRSQRGGSSVKTWVMIAEGGLALVGLGLGVASTLAANGKSDRISELQRENREADEGNPNPCRQAAPQNAVRCRELDAVLDDKHRFRDVATVSYIGSGVMAAALVGTWLLWKPAGDDNASAFRINVGPTPGGLMWTASGQF